MSDQRLLTWLLVAAVAVSVVATIVAAWHARFALGMVAGMWWNVASLWCLTRLLAAWLGPHPSRRRAIGWLLVKFPLLYAVVLVLLRAPSVSSLGFGVGFSAGLLLLMVALGFGIPLVSPARSYGR